jgi:hypothetical protein
VSRFEVASTLNCAIYCAHGNKETKLSHLNSQESFGVSINFVSREKGCVKGGQAGGNIEDSSQKEE